MDKRETQLCNMYTYITFYAKLYSLLGRGGCKKPVYPVRRIIKKYQTGLMNSLNKQTEIFLPKQNMYLVDKI